MNQSASTSNISEELKAEAVGLLLKSLQVSILEETSYAEEVMPQFASYITHGGLPPQGVYPWVTEMMYHAVMPDHSVCTTTKLEQFRIHVIDMVTKTPPPAAVSLELRRAMIGHGCIYSYSHDEDEGDSAEFAEITGYGIAKLLGLDLASFISEHWPAESAA